MAARQEGVLDPALGGGPPPPPPPAAPTGPGMPYYQYAHSPVAPSPGGEPVYQQPPHVAAGNVHYAPPMAEHSTPAQEDTKRPRACDSCRNLKVKCELPEDRPDLPCRRCAKTGRECHITPPTRKRQKKEASRVAELEKRLEELTSTVAAQAGARISHFASPAEQAPDRLSDSTFGRQSISYISQPSPSTPYYTSHENAPANKRRRTDDSPYPPRSSLPHSRASPSTATAQHSSAEEANSIEMSWAIASDVTRFLHHTTPQQFVQRINTLIPPEKAPELFNRYNTEMAPHLPAVIFPLGMTADQLFKEKPLLYLSVLGAAAYGHTETETSRSAVREAIGTIADCAVRNGAKSLELIQSMQVIALWYKPPEQAEQTNFYQIINIAATMVYDLGLNQRFNIVKARRGLLGPAKDVASNRGISIAPVNSDELESRRALLGCYYLCASAAMVLRRSIRFDWTKYTEDCIEDLMTNPEAAPTDRLLCQHVKLQRICEEVGQQFRMHDASATISLDDAQVAYNVRHFENELRRWKDDIPVDCRTPGLLFFEHVCSLYAHEIVLHHNHNVDDFKMPFNEESLKNVNAGFGKLTQNQMNSLQACVKAAHGILDAMLDFDGKTITSLPMLLYFVRCVYAVVILIKMHVAVCIPNSELGKLFQAEDLRVEYYLNGLIDHITTVARERSIRPNKLIRILKVLRDWFEEKHKKGLGGNQSPPDGAHETKLESTDGQSGLQMLSQVATGHQAQNGEAPPNWNLDRPQGMPYGHRYNPNVQSNPTYHASDNSTYNMPNYAQGFSSSMQDPSMSEDYGWGGLGVQQAMDMAFADMNGLQGNGLDNWLLGGDSMMPFVSYESNAPPTSGMSANRF